MSSHFWFRTILSLILMTSFGSVFASGPSSKSIRIDIQGGSANIEVVETWKHLSDNETLIVRQPLPPNANNLNLYLNSKGVSKQVLQGENKKKYLLDLVRSTNDSSYFSLGKEPFKNLLISEPLLLEEEENTIKYEWSEPLVSIHDFSSLTVFLHEKVFDEEVKIDLVFHGNSTHFFSPNYPSKDFLFEDNTLVWHWSGNTFSEGDFNFFITNKSEAKLSHSRDNFIYHAHFIRPFRADLKDKNILLLIDQSGSMYGERWAKVKTILPDVLREIGNNRIKIGLFDEEFFFLTEEFEPNTLSHQKNWREFVSETTPTGKSDWDFWREFIRNLNDSERVDYILVLGEFSDFKVPENIDFWKQYSKPIMFLDFGKNVKISNWTQLFNGSYISLFSSGYDFYELDEFQSLWNHLGNIYKAENLTSVNELSEVRPVQINQYKNSLVYVERVPQEEVVLDYQRLGFLSQWWGQFQVAFHLKTYLENEAFLDGAEAALPSILEYFGIDLSLNYLSNFNHLDYFEKVHYIQALESIYNPNFLSLYKGVPLYGEKVLSPFDYTTEGRSLIRVKPYSEAYFKLYEDYSGLVGEPFSWQDNVAFCVSYRCVEVVENGDNLFNFSHRLFWNRSFGTHWADKYLMELAQKNIVEVPVSGEIVLDKAISRGEFFIWVAHYLYPEEVKNVILESELVFNDINQREEDLVKSLTLLHDKNILEGFLDGSVRPDSLLLRAEAVKVLLAIHGYEPKSEDYFLGDKPPFSDLDSWEIPWVLGAFNKGIVKGYEDGTFKPFNSLNRAEAAKILVETFKD